MGLGWASRGGRVRKAWMVSGMESNSDLSRAVADMLRFWDATLFEKHSIVPMDTAKASGAPNHVSANFLSSGALVVLNDSSTMRCSHYTDTHWRGRMEAFRRRKLGRGYEQNRWTESKSAERRKEIAMYGAIYCWVQCRRGTMPRSPSAPRWIRGPLPLGGSKLISC